MTTLQVLHQTLNQRKRPEDVAQMILELIGQELSYKEKIVLEKAAKGSLKRTVYNYTSMSEVFGNVVGAEQQINKAIEIFELEVEEDINGNDVNSIENFIKKLSILIHKDFGNNNFITDRLSKEERKKVGLDISKRKYNKKWRLLRRLEKKLKTYKNELKKLEFQKISKHGICHLLNIEEFSKDLNTACFIAYYNARCNLRSTFTNQSQERSFDEISEMLLNRCLPKRNTFFSTKTIENHTNWWAMAHIYTGEKVIFKLTDTQKGELLGIWTTILQEIATFLDMIWKGSEFNRKTMIVRKGNDSTTWNNTAGAWNKARDNWMNLIYALGMDYVLDELCFGKVMRLMAADVAYWHRASGSGLEPNTKVWYDLPLPWEVFQEKADCNRKLVIQKCELAGINAEKSGWIAPRKHGIAMFKPTPELVHGVTIGNPFLASILKKHRYFSGKKVSIIVPQNN